MLIYIFLVVCIILFARLCTARDMNIPIDTNSYTLDKNTNKYLYIISTLFILLAALRADNVGIDTSGYKNAFLNYRGLTSLHDILNERLEPLFVFVSYSLHLLGGFFWLKLFVVCTNVILIFRSVNKYSSIVWLSCLLYFTFSMYRANFNEMRQAVAIGITVFGFQFIIDKKLWKYLLTVGIAFLFHKSSLIMLPLYFFCYWDSIKRWHILLIIGLLSAVWVNTYIFLNLINQIGRNTYETNEETGGWLFFVLQILTISIAFVLRDKLNKSRINVCVFFMVAFAVILFPICHLNPNFFRLVFYVWIYMIILVPNMLNSIRSKFIRIIGILSYSVIGLYIAFNQTYTESTQFIPYLFFWE